MDITPWRKHENAISCRLEAGSANAPLFLDSEAKGRGTWEAERIKQLTNRARMDLWPACTLEMGMLAEAAASMPRKTSPKVDLQGIRGLGCEGRKELCSTVEFKENFLT
jgi:hypothetical protein